MIIKVRTNDINSHLDECPIKSSWRLYDDVKGLHYTVFSSENKMREDFAKMAVSSDVQEIWLTQSKPADDEILFAAFSSESMGCIHLFCNTECYLLNDQGRNIERLI